MLQVLLNNPPTDKKLARARPEPPLARPSPTGTALKQLVPRIAARARCRAWPLPAGPHLGPQAGSVRKNGGPFSAPPRLAPTLLTEECTCSSLSAFRSPLNAFTNSDQLGRYITTTRALNNALLHWCALMLRLLFP